MIDPLSVWKSSLAALPKVSDSSWSNNFAGWVADRVVNITTNPSNLVLTSPLIFIFNTSAFAAALLSLAPTTDATAGITAFADAWANTISTITYPTSLSVATGASDPSAIPTYKGTFSTITSVIIQPASILSGKAKIIELASAVPVSDPNDSLFPVKFRDAFLELKIKVVGLDSDPGTPSPLTVSNIPLI